ncbi:MAG TPA: hypothetical protein VJZ27_07960, partial [Aggregatilineales bacterium]|nr:hypothetical protein [Aggregatilineales bacterium]
MSTNATTWFYQQPEKGRAYLIAERVNHTFWTNRVTGIYFSCVNAEPPFRLIGDWQGINVEIEFEPNTVFILRMSSESVPFVKGCSEILGFPPTVSYQDSDNRHIVEWYAKNAGKRLQEVQGNPSFRNIKLYKR